MSRRPDGSTYDVAIIGGGIIGTSAAAFLAEAGLSVLLVERSAIGSGASGRNSGSIQSPFDPALTGMHRATVSIYRQLAERDPEFLLDDRPAGVLLVGSDEAAMEELWRDLAATQSELRPTLVPASDLREQEPGLADDLLAVRLQTGYPVPPAAATAAFARWAESAGALIEIGTARPAYDRGAVIGVEVDDRLRPAGMVLVAAGFESPELIPTWTSLPPVRAVWGVNVDVALRRPPVAVIEQAGVEGVATADIDSPEPRDPTATPSVFSLVTAAGSSSLGSTFLPWLPNPAVLAPVLRDRGARFVPELREATIRSIRACARPQSLDGRPLVGAIQGVQGLFICTGHGPWGISTGPGSSELVAGLMLGRSVEIPAELTPERFER